MQAGQSDKQPRAPTLKRELGVLALVATAVCTVIGGGINVLSVEIQDKVPGMNGLVPLVFVVGAIPALLTALSYAVLASAMPRAGGGYIYCSRALHPYVGFIATFSKWFGLAAACGVIAYIDVPLLRAAAEYAGLTGVAASLEVHSVQLLLPLVMLWVFWGVNLVGVRTYGITVIVLMILMLLGGVVIIGVGLLSSPGDYAQALLATKGIQMDEFMAEFAPRPATFWVFMQGASFLFFAYIGFAGISQAGGEAKEPVRTLPRAFVLAMIVITAYYVLFSVAVYRAIPWQYVARFAEVSEAQISVPELMGVLMPKGLAVFVALMSALALANDIPPMLMAVSRLFFAWAKDGVIPRRWAHLNQRFHTPHWSLTISTIVASLFVFVCDLWFREGVETIVVALLFTYMLVAASVVAFPWRNPELYRRVSFLRERGWQVFVGVGAVATVGMLVGTTIANDVVRVLQKGITLDTVACATGFWVLALLLGTVIFLVMWTKRTRQGVDMPAVFRELPDEGETLALDVATSE